MLIKCGVLESVKNAKINDHGGLSFFNVSLS